MDAAPRISIIIPAYNEEAYLPRLLESIEVARERYGAGRGAVEVIVADNGSTDGTAAVARSDRSGSQEDATRRRVAARDGGGARERVAAVAVAVGRLAVHRVALARRRHDGDVAQREGDARTAVVIEVAGLVDRHPEGQPRGVGRLDVGAAGRRAPRATHAEAVVLLEGLRVGGPADERRPFSLAQVTGHAG
ncbi:MAG: glycosyltransferase, partial [Deltaproteobacteria bacterium]|nr:glycosyltransferase [Deltaproteobacteria bacterium]